MAAFTHTLSSLLLVFTVTLAVSSREFQGVDGFHFNVRSVNNLVSVCFIYSNQEEITLCLRTTVSLMTPSYVQHT